MTAPRDIVLQWNDAALAAIKADKTAPPIAARNLAVMHVAVYDAVNAVTRSHAYFRVRASALPNSSPEAAAAVAAHRTLISLYPKQVASFDAVLDATLASIPEGVGKTNGTILGHAVAEKVLAWRAGDMTLRRSEYSPTAVLGHWQPTPPDFKPPLLPQWTAVRPFALSSASKFHPVGPPSVTSPEFAAAYREVNALGGTTSSRRTPEQTQIARFWADGEGTVTPPGHWNRIAQTVAVSRQLSLADNARLFAMLNVALADAAIACWDCKYKFDVWRPVTAIRTANRLDNPDLTANPDWMPLLPTPPFPAYTSGHSTFSGAAAAVLTAFFGGAAARFSTTSDGLPRVTRSFSGFQAAADEAGMSRIYGGIHWSFDNRDGLDLGKQIGEYVSQSFFQPK
ncbi:MAG: phosphatase PAP2 family protein [Gemmataceae bacterium]